MSEIKNVAIIMDGNGRWAKARFKPRVWGHIRGSKIVSEIVEAASDLKLNSLTLYAFSTENWSRPFEEINTLFKLLEKYLIKERPRIIKNNIRFKVIGNISKLPSSTKKLIDNLELETSTNLGLRLNFAFSYGSKQEIVNGINSYINKNPGKEITEDNLKNYLEIDYDIDLLIRTGGDIRVSNFLLWQLAYSEFYFSKLMWPEFNKKSLETILKEVSKRDRRFGSLRADSSYEESKLTANKKIKEIHYE